MAPKPGTETRALVGEWLKEAQQKAKDLAASRRASGEDDAGAEIGDPESGAA